MIPKGAIPAAWRLNQDETCETFYGEKCWNIKSFNFNDLLQRKNFTSYHVWLCVHVLTITYRSIAHIVIETFSEQL